MSNDKPPTFEEILNATNQGHEIVEISYCQEDKRVIYLLLRHTETSEMSIAVMFPDDDISTYEEAYIERIPNNYEKKNTSLNVINHPEEHYIVLQLIDNDTSTIILYNYDQYGNNYNLEISKIENLNIKNKIHSAISDDPKRRLLLIDKEDSHFINVPSKSLRTVSGTHILSMVIENLMEIYYFLKIDKEQGDGLYQLDITGTFKLQKPSYLPLAYIKMGANSQLILGLEKSRIGFFQSYDQYTITILPSRNQNRFYNDIGKENYKLYNQIDDRIVIVGDNKMYSYDIVTAKLLQVNDSDCDLNGYSQFTPKGYDTIIFVSDDPFKRETDQGWQLSDFFPAHMSKTTTMNQMSFRQSQCPKDLHIFKLIQVQSDSHIEILVEFKYPYSKDYSLNLHVNKDRDHLIARDELGVFFYKLQKQGKGPEVKLELIRQISEFSYEIQKKDYLYRLDMFSPNFTRYIFYDPINHFKGRFLLLDAFTGAQILVFPFKLLFYDNEEKKDETLTPQSAINRLSWIDEDTMRIINLKEIEFLVEIDAENGCLNKLQFNVIPLFKELYIPEWKELYHLIHSRKSESDPIIKLQKMYQEYKSAQHLTPDITEQELSKLMMKQDFTHFNCVSHSFTLQSWTTAFNLQNGMGGLSIDNMSEKTLLTLIYSIFPGGDTVFHYLTKNADELYKLLNFCHPDAKSIKYPIPFIKNAKGKTPLHLCIQNGATKAANTFLRYLSLYGIDHHSREITDLLPEMLRLKLGDLDIYMESRFQQSPSHQDIEKLYLYDSIQYCTFHPLVNNDEIQELIRHDVDQGKLNFRKVQVQTLDIASIYHYDDPLEDQFFDALANTDEFSYFELKSIQALINFNYPLVQKFLIKKLFLPYICFHCAYLVLIFILFERRYEEVWIYFYWAGLASNCVFAIYFLVNELKQISKDGINYFKSFWNYIDMIPIFGIYLIGVFSIIDGIVQLAKPEDRVSGTIQRIVVSIVTLFMWLKFLYFFRIFDKTGYMIRAVVECVKAMRYFFFILLFTIFAFGNAFLIISLGNDGQANPDSVFIVNYIDSLTFSYRMLLGDFDTGAFGETAVPLVQILFFIFTVFNIIVMLNLLVAVISDAYAEVAEAAEQAMYQERASMIAENNYLIPESERKSYAKKGQYIVVINDLELEETTSGSDAIMQRVEMLKGSIQEKLQKSKNSAEKERVILQNQFQHIQNFMLSTLLKEVINCSIYKKKLTRKYAELQIPFQIQNDLATDTASPSWKI